MPYSIKTRVALALLAVAGLLVAAPSAMADDYCVGSIPGGCTGTPEPDVQTALDAAAATTTTADRVLIGPGTYSRADGFVNTGNSSANALELRGVGSPLPALTMTTAGTLVPVLTAGYAATVADLAIQIPSEGNYSRGLLLGGAGAVQNVSVTGPASPPGGFQQTGIQSNGLATISGVNVSVSPSVSIGMYLSASGANTVTDSTLIGARGIDLAVGPGATATLSRNRISATNDGIYMYYGDVDVDNTLIDLRGGSGEAIHMSTVQATNNSNTIDANQLTIRNGDANSTGVRQFAGNVNAIQTINLRDSIIWDVGHPLEQDTPSAGATYTFNAFLMDYDKANNLPASPVAGQVRNESTINTVDPGFLNPVSGANGLSGDYRLAFDSLMIDQDATYPLLYPEETDLRGLSRIVDGAAPFTADSRDIGAYEYQHAAPTAQASASPSPATTGQPVTFNATASDMDGDALTYAWTFDDGGTATGASPTHAFGTPGTHTAALTVTDPTGLTGSATAQVNVVTPPPPPTTSALTGQQAAALKKCKKIKNKAKRKKCKKRARRLPL